VKTQHTTKVIENKILSIFNRNKR